MEQLSFSVNLVKKIEFTVLIVLVWKGHQVLGRETGYLILPLKHLLRTRRDLCCSWGDLGASIVFVYTDKVHSSFLFPFEDSHPPGNN